MKVTLVSPYDPWPTAGTTDAAYVGGVERVFDEVAQALARRGHDVTLVCSSRHATGSFRRGDLRVVRARRRMTILRAPVARLARHVEPGQDVVHVAATYPFTTPRVLSRARRLRMPSVLDFHFEPGPGTPLGRLAASLYSRLGPRTYLWASAVLVRSLEYGRRSRSLTVVPEERWRVVPNGIDVSRFRPNGHLPHEGYVLFVGRLVPYKGVGVLLRAVARLRPRPPIVIAGEGPLRASLEKQARSLGVDARFLGRVSDERLPELYRAAAITVLPSVTPQEAFGLALLESMACGTPVVASALPGVEEVALNGGLVARPGDEDALAAQLERALRPGLLPRGATLADRVHAAYSWDAIAARISNVYEEVVTRPASTGGAKEVTAVAPARGDALL